jgi:hypothetical protein
MFEKINQVPAVDGREGGGPRSRQLLQQWCRRPWLVVAAFTLAVVTNIVALSSPASAAVPGLGTVFADSALDSRNKSVTAFCPPGKKLVGTGFVITSEWGGEILVTKVLPHSDLSGVTVSAVEDRTGFAPDWRLRALARCADPLPGLVRISASSWHNGSSISPKNVTAPCPTGKNVLGTGFTVTHAFGSPSGDVALSSVVPNRTLTTVAARADELGGSTASWSLDAHAICADPLPGLERRAGTSDLDSGNWRNTQVVFCPEGTFTGMGIALEGLFGTGSLAGHGVISRAEFAVYDPPGADSDVSQATGHEDERGYGGDWEITAYAICATG